MMAMKPAPHQWVMIPETTYERRAALRVRESRHTVMLWDRKYLNIDTGKYDTDRLPTLYSEDLYHIMRQSDVAENDQRHQFSRYSYLPKFVPKDNDFDEEESQIQLTEQKKEKQKKLEAEESKRKIEIATANIEKERKRLDIEEKEMLYRHNQAALVRAQETKAMQDRVANEYYQKQLQQVRARVAQEKRIELASVTNIRPNKWTPK